MHAVLTAAIALAALVGCAPRGGPLAQSLYINPPGLSTPTGYTHVVVGPDRRTVYIAGQIALDSTGALVGEGDFAAQAEQVYGNLRRALASAGGTFDDLVKTTTFVVDVNTNIQALRTVRARAMGSSRVPANTLVPVPALARPGLLIEVEAVAILREPLARPD